MLNRKRILEVGVPTWNILVLLWFAAYTRSCLFWIKGWHAPLWVSFSGSCQCHRQLQELPSVSYPAHVSEWLFCPSSSLLPFSTELITILNRGGKKTPQILSHWYYCRFFCSSGQQMAADWHHCTAGAATVWPWCHISVPIPVVQFHLCYQQPCWCLFSHGGNLRGEGIVMERILINILLKY